MFAAKLAAIPGISPSTAKAILVLGLGALSAGLMALVQDGTLAGRSPRWRRSSRAS
jgi:hypothetical protein